jgi:nitrogenase molybdenum-iron protein NifN
MLHGSQGCATYIRRYLISHFREPMDIASSNFSEETTIFGGNTNFNHGINNIISQYHPKVIAIASTCLAETIGEDVQRMIYEYKEIHKDCDVSILFASTPSYMGTHYEGFHEAVSAIIKAFARRNNTLSIKNRRRVNLFSNFISPEDIRHLKEIMTDYGIDTMLCPDYSDTLDGTSWDIYKRIPEGGTGIEALNNCGQAYISIELGNIIPVKQSAGEYLRDHFDVICRHTGLPVGINETDKFFEILNEITKTETPEKYKRQRGRLIDLYIDGHKYVSGKKVIIYGEEDFVIALSAFTAEIGLKPVLCATGGESGRLKETLINTLGEQYPEGMIIGQGMTFEQMEETVKTNDLQPDLMIGNSKGYYIARKLNIPLVRTGFPIHDRIGAAHKRMLGYEGTTILFEEIVNALLEDKQRKSTTGYKYM